MRGVTLTQPTAEVALTETYGWCVEAAEGWLQLVVQLSVFLDIRACCRKAACNILIVVNCWLWLGNRCIRSSTTCKHFRFPSFARHIRLRSPCGFASPHVHDQHCDGRPALLATDIPALAFTSDALSAHILDQPFVLTFRLDDLPSFVTPIYHLHSFVFIYLTYINSYYFIPIRSYFLLDFII